MKTSLTVSAAGALSAAPLAAAASASPAAGREYYELRAYRLKPGASLDLLDAYWEKAAMPALNRLGVSHVGVFTENEPKDGAALWVLIPHASVESFVTVSAGLNADPAVLAAGADYLQVGKAAPAFERVDTWLLLAFAGMPKMELPAYSRDRQPRVFEMRSYESYSEVKALKKMAMFNDGEIDVMREVKLAPVFYGQALAGPNLPHLTYFTSAPDMASHKEHWKAFGAHPKWVAMKDDPQYADTVSKNTPRFLTPRTYSQI